MINQENIRNFVIMVSLKADAEITKLFNTPSIAGRRSGGSF